jgi:3-polyprenyl-4-hydroxybenzoate decarboxylase
LPREHISRSQRSQGPYGPKIEFRLSKQDEEYLQPRLRFTNVTDKQRMSESAMNFIEKVERIYERFEASKSRLGRTMREDTKRYEAIRNAGESTKMRSQSLKRRYSREEHPE